MKPIICLFTLLSSYLFLMDFLHMQILIFIQVAFSFCSCYTMRYTIDKAVILTIE